MVQGVPTALCLLGVHYLTPNCPVILMNEKGEWVIVQTKGGHRVPLRSMLSKGNGVENVSAELIWCEMNNLPLN